MDAKCAFGYPVPQLVDCSDDKKKDVQSSLKDWRIVTSAVFCGVALVGFLSPHVDSYLIDRTDVWLIGWLILALAFMIWWNRWRLDQAEKLRNVTKRSNHATHVGFLGGFVGGLLVGVVVALLYIPKQGDDGSFQWGMEIAAAGAFTGATLGFFCAFFASRLRSSPLLEGFLTSKIFNLKSGAIFLFFAGVIGGAVAGGISGPLLGVYFGSKPGYMVEPDLILQYSLLIGAFVISISILGAMQKFSKAFLLKYLIGVLIFAGSFLVLGSFSEFQNMMEFVYTFLGRSFETFFFPVRNGECDQPDPHQMLLGGLLYGSCVGTVLGVSIGLDLFLEELETKD